MKHDLREPPPDTSPYPPLYTPFKFLSMRLAVLLRNAPLSSNALTIAWGLLLVGASVAIAYERALIAVPLVMMAVLFDCLDGDLARARRQPSVSGTLLEQLAHWVGNMALAAGTGAAILLDDPSHENVLIASTLNVAQCVYIAVVRQIRPDAANIAEHPHVRRAFRATIKGMWRVSPIELPLIAMLVVFGVTQTSVLVLTALLAVASTLVFGGHFILTRATDRRAWAAATPRRPVFVDAASTRAQLIRTRMPDARWWTPGTPKLPAELLAILGQQAMAAGAPVLAAAARDLEEQLPQLFRTSGRVLALASPAELAMEAACISLLRPSEKVLAVGGRASSRRWRAIATLRGLELTDLDVAFGASITRDELAAALDGHPAPDAVVLSLTESEDGSATDLAAVAEVLRARSPLIIIDATVGLGADDLQMDAWGIDVALSDSSSAVMTPPGVALLALGPRALARLGQPAPCTPLGGTALDLRTHLSDPDGTYARIPAPALASLYTAVQMILSVGVDAILAHHRELSRRFRRGCVEDAGLTLVAENPSSACTVAVLPADIDLATLQGALFGALRMVIASGTAPDGATTLQFGHAGWLFDDDVDLAVDALAAALRGARSAQSK